MAGTIIADTVQYGSELPCYTWRKGGKGESDTAFRLCVGSASAEVAGSEVMEVDEGKNVRFYGNIQLDNLTLGDNSLNGSAIKDGSLSGTKIQSGTTLNGNISGTAEQAKKDQNGNVITTTYATKTELTSLSNTVDTKLNQAQADLIYAKKADLDSKANVAGNRGGMAGYETATSYTNSQTITENSPDSVLINTSGATTITFTPAQSDHSATKAITLTATQATVLTISGAVWANAGEAPTWGNAGKHLVLVAFFAGGRVILSVYDNDDV